MRRFRYRIARELIHIGLMIMPPSRFKDELLAVMYALHRKVLETIASKRDSARVASEKPE